MKGHRRRPLRASAGHPVTQLWYARQGIITPEMEFIAIRENMRAARITDMTNDIARHDLDKQHEGSSQAQSQFTPRSSASSRSASPRRSPPNSSAAKSPPAAPSSPPISITRNSSP